MIEKCVDGYTGCKIDHAKLIGVEMPDDLTSKFLEAVNQDIDNLDTEIGRLTADRNKKKRILGRLNEIFDSLSQTTKKPENPYFVKSRTAGPGHYMERIEGTDTVKCSCRGFEFRGRCWASDMRNRIDSDTSL